MYDVIVVGARCAGASTALLLARHGYQVLLLDRASFPSDQPMSTHLIYPPGVLRLRRWGLLDQVRASGCPPAVDFGLRTNLFDISGPSLPAEDVTEAYAPRRYILDDLLVQAAVAAGAKLIEGVSVQNLLFDDSGAVTGIAGQVSNGGKITERARVTVGADGTNSLVARQVGAPEYNTHPVLLGNWWTYWQGCGIKTVRSYVAEHRLVYCWPTNDDCALVGVAWPMEAFRRLGHDTAAQYFSVLGKVVPEIAELLRDCPRAERFMRGSVRNFFRKPHGPGWALVGDAGYSKDPCTAAGITDAFQDAELLAEALHSGLSGQRSLAVELADYERRRNERAFPFYDFICDFAKLEPLPAELAPIMEYIQRDPAESSRAASMFTQTMSPARFYSEENLTRLINLAQG